jgi:hypothetical protein
MENRLEDRIRERAYEIWSMAGRPDGKADHHWLLAEREVLAMAMAEPLPVAARRISRSRATGLKSKTRAVA